MFDFGEDCPACIICIDLCCVWAGQCTVFAAGGVEPTGMRIQLKISEELDLSRDILVVSPQLSPLGGLGLYFYATSS